MFNFQVISLLMDISMEKVDIIKNTGMVFTLIVLNMINISFAIGSEHTDKAAERRYGPDSYFNHGYKPVMDGYSGLEGDKEQHDNLLFKEWCENTFSNGNCIYEGYKDIAFNIKYTHEKAGTDNWQTPYESIRLMQGDCEDAVFLFFFTPSALSGKR